MRLAEANGVAHVRQLFAIIGLTASTAVLFSANDIAEIAAGNRSLSKTEADELTKEATDLTAGGRITGKTRFCPACLVERGIWKSEWDLPLSIGCEEHKLHLLTCCERCGSRLSYFDRRPLLQCRCGYDLRRSAHLPAPVFTAKLNSIFRPWFTPHRSWRPDLEEWQLDRKALVVLKRLIWEIGDNEGSFGDSGERGSLTFGPRHYPGAEAMLANWPDSLVQPLGDRLHQWPVGQRTKFAALARNLAPLGVRTLVIGLVRNMGHSNRRLGGKKSLSEPPGVGLVTLERVRRALGVDSLVSRRMFSEGRMARATMSTGRRHKWVDREELHFAQWLRREYPTLLDAAAFLGCQRAAILALIRDGWLKAYADPRAPQVPRVNVREMADLIGRVAKRAKLAAPADKKLRLLSDVRARGRYGKSKKGSLLSRVFLHGDIVLYHRDDASLGLANFAVLESDLQFLR